MLKKRKSGPRGGLYDKLSDGSALPKAPKPWRKLSKIQQSRLIALRARFRSRETPERYQRLARFVRRLRKAKGMTQVEFAKAVGVSVASVKRYENASGHFPKPGVIDKIKKMV